MYNDQYDYQNYANPEEYGHNQFDNTQNANQFNQSFNWGQPQNTYNQANAYWNNKHNQSFAQPQRTSMSQGTGRKGGSQRRSFNPLDTTVPAGVAAFVHYNDSDEEAKIRERSPNKWHMDDSTYEPRRPKFKLNRQSTEDLEMIKKQ